MYHLVPHYSDLVDNDVINAYSMPGSSQAVVRILFLLTFHGKILCNLFILFLLA